MIYIVQSTQEIFQRIFIRKLTSDFLQNRHFESRQFETGWAELGLDRQVSKIRERTHIRARLMCLCAHTDLYGAY